MRIDYPVAQQGAVAATLIIRPKSAGNAPAPTHGLINKIDEIEDNPELPRGIRATSAISPPVRYSADVRTFGILGNRYRRIRRFN